jgi:two-component system phosphate regulon sensor histidine kinase PhoR
LPASATWIVLLLAAVALIGLHRRWKRRYAASEQNWHREVEAMRRRHDEIEARAHAQQHALFNSMVEGFLLLDRDGRVLLANQALEKLFGATGITPGQTIMEALRLHQVAELVARLSKEGQVRDFELQIPGLDARSLEVNAAAILSAQGQPQGSILVFHDITRLKQLENTRQEFVANVSHELRTPLSLIKGYVETLIDHAKDNPEYLTRFLEIIEKHADRLTFLIEDLLTISRLESGQVSLNLQKLDLHEAVQRCCDDLESKAAEKGVVFHNAVPPGLIAKADGDRIQQVLTNLVDNAIKYGRRDGCVNVGARLAEGNKIEVWVKDDGPGIPPDAIERIFERFYRVDKARSREAGGTGLGLSIVKHIVQAHGGEVWAQSEPGKGAEFYLTLNPE